MSNLPMCSVFPIETRSELSGTIRDKVEYDIGIQVAVNVKNYLGAASGETILATQEALINLIEENNNNDGWLPNTVMGILKANLAVGGKVIFTDNIKVKYDTYLNPKKFPVAFCIITFTAFDRKNRI